MPADEKGKTCAQRFSTYGAIVGIVVMFFLPTGGSILSAALIGAVCGGVGALLGGLIGAAVDAANRRPRD